MYRMIDRFHHLFLTQLEYHKREHSHEVSNWLNSSAIYSHGILNSSDALKMDAFPGIISVVVFVAVVISSSISLRLLGKEPVASNTNISTWILNCALANYLHCLFILPIGIGFHSLGLQDLHIVEDIWMELETPFSLQFHSVAFLFVIFSEHMKIRQLSKIKAHALVFLSVFVTSLCFMFPQIIIRATNTEDRSLFYKNFIFLLL